MFFILLRRRRRGFSLTRAQDQCWYVYDVEQECENNSTSPLTHSFNALKNNSASKLSFKMWCTPSFRPSEIIYKKRSKPERHKQANSNSKRSEKSSRTTQSRIFFRNFSLSLTFLLPSFSLSTSLSFRSHSPSMPWLDQLSFSFAFTPNGRSFFRERL